jgi:hypothetical protein
MVLFNDMRRFEAGKLSGKGEENDVVEAMKKPPHPGHNNRDKREKASTTQREQR